MKIGFDIGGTKIQYVIYKDDDLKVSDVVIPIIGKEKEEVLDIISEVIKSNYNKSLKVAISSPTAVNKITGFCKGISGIKGYENFNLYEELNDRLYPLCVPIIAINDGKAAMLGIVHKNFNEKPESAVMITLGTGIGGAIYINGEIFPGVDNMAGEIGYPIWYPKTRLNVSRSLSPFNIFSREFNGADGSKIMQMYGKNDVVTKKIDIWMDEMVRFVNMLAFTVNPMYILFTGSISKNLIFTNLLQRKYLEFLNKHELNNLLSTTLKFFDDSDSNYNIIGALSLLDV